VIRPRCVRCANALRMVCLELGDVDVVHAVAPAVLVLVAVVLKAEEDEEGVPRDVDETAASPLEVVQHRRQWRVLEMVVPCNHRRAPVSQVGRAEHACIKSNRKRSPLGGRRKFTLLAVSSFPSASFLRACKGWGHVAGGAFYLTRNPKRPRPRSGPWPSSWSAHAAYLPRPNHAKQRESNVKHSETTRGTANHSEAQ